MEGIVGILLQKRASLIDPDKSEIKNLFSNLLERSTTLGKNSSGIAVFNRSFSPTTIYVSHKKTTKYHKHDLYIYKAPCSPFELVKKEGYKKVIDKVGSDTVAILGYSGNKLTGNQPQYSETICGVTSGNRSRVFESAKEDYITLNKENSSKQLLHYIEKLQENRGIEFQDALNQVFPKIKKTAAVVCNVEEDIDSFYLIRNGKPLAAKIWPTKQAFIFASRKGFIPEAYKKASILNNKNLGPELQDVFFPDKSIYKIPLGLSYKKKHTWTNEIELFQLNSN
jgi:hypothetical protein